MIKILLGKKIKQHEIDYHLARKFERVMTQKYWFSEYEFLNPIFCWINGDTHVDQARTTFGEQYLKRLNTDARELNELVKKMEMLEERVEYFESIIEKSK